MSVLSKIKNFLNNHKNKFIITGAVVGGVYLASRYAQYKLREWQERETKEFLERTRKQQHFESTERTCNQTIISLSSTLNDNLTKLQNTDEIIAEIKDNPSNKVELWDKLKIVVFTRICTLIYVNVLLIIVLRIQLNLIGGYLYKDTKAVTSTMQQNYLSMCHVLLENGLEKILEVVNKTVREVIVSYDLKKRLNLYDIEQMFWSIQVKITENRFNPIQYIIQTIIPAETPANTDLYNAMVTETVDILESEEVQSLATSCTNRCFTNLIDKLSDYYSPNGIPSSSKDKDTFLHPSKVQIPLAKLIPIFNGLLTKTAFPEFVTQQLINDDKLKMLGANIYEVFCHN